ncbi:glycosyltransferase family 2 protein [Phenylobacterium sp.]|jgi:dolichol-phosphate mannosyltransferase|uniref:glycosyltransferase family 2 protein n=1 Tax=Phenylobacterium sp. TaxID=1871053 RepID=UPI001219C4FD|nr:glycosyltransferase family 2 protein [Phenylobacterium sp.]THD51505.1 MAG: glycosyltransferase family 2 protein [Phenylobacterium sp.]
MSAPSGAKLRHQSAPSAHPLELGVIVPTFKEAPNVRPLLEKLEAALQGVVWQVIFVDDDSPDGTAATVKEIAAIDPRVICLHRIGRRGLAGAVIEGAMASAAPFVAVIDGDLQHDETLLPQMLKALQDDRADLVVGSRYIAGQGPVGGFDKRRAHGSLFATWLGRKVLKLDLSDPMSGFFAIRRSLVERAAPKLSTDGFKLLFDLASVLDPPPRVVELPYVFRERHEGESKLDGRVVAHYLSLLASKLSRDVLSPRALLFGLVGLSGVLVNVAVVYALSDLRFLPAQAIGAVVAMTSNYLINNTVTYRDKRKRGLALLTGYLRFCLLCAIGLAANVAVASLAFQLVPHRWVGVVAGAAVGAAWNYITTSLAVW